MIETGFSGFMLHLVDIVCDILRNKAIEKYSKNIALEIPAIDRVAQVLGNGPDRLDSSCFCWVLVAIFKKNENFRIE